jgi:PII-like signaling protein
MHPAKLIEIHCSEQDRYDDKPLHEAIVERCRALKIAGATVLRGVEGYGGTAVIHREHLVKHDLPITVLVVDSAEQIFALVPVLEQMLEKTVMAVSDVKMRRVQENT